MSGRHEFRGNNGCENRFFQVCNGHARAEQGSLRGGWCLRSFLLALAVMLLVCAGAMAENLLTNGSFEELDAEGMPVGWSTDAYVMDEGYTIFTVTEEDCFDGTTAAAIRNIGDNDARFMQKVAVEPESLYRFSGYIRTEEVEGGRGANLSIEGLYAFSESVYDTSDGWQYIEWYGETGEDQTSVTLFARLGGYSGESRGRAWFDDLRLEEVDAVPGDGIAARWYQERTVSVYDEDEEDIEEDEASAAWPRLIMLTLVWTLISLMILQWLRRRPEKPGKGEGAVKYWFWGGLALALGLRMILSYYIEGYMVDVNCFLSWGGTMASHGPVNFYPQTNFCDYPPAYTYILGLNALICRWIPGISAGMQRVIFRFVPSLCDLLACVVLDVFLKRKHPEISGMKRRAALLLLAFHPVMVMNSAAWGQMDSALALLLLLVAIWAIEGKWQLCLPCYMLSVLVKPQALMLGFLGLAAIIFAWVREKESRKRILIGVGAAIGVLLIIVVPFSLKQDPLWIVNQYAGTLASYPYATVNTANYYYLFGGNWSAIANQASLWCCLGMALLPLGFGAAVLLRAGKKWRRTWIEAALSVLFAAWFIYCAITGASWSLVGIGAMAFAFVIVLSLYIRKGEVRFLPYVGGLLFLLLYTFGVKMHERYIFPAFLLLALAYGLKRDRRILIVLGAVTCTTFINEGIVLDNSIRLGSSLGHLNQDTYILAMILSAVNVAAALYAVWLGLDMAQAETEAEETQHVHRLLKDFPQDNRLHWKKKDTLLMCAILAVYSVVSFLTLGSTRAPQTAWTSTEYTENVVLDLGEEQEDFYMLYFCRVSRYDFSVAVSDDGENWTEETWAQMDQGQCWKWKYVTDSVQGADGTRSYNSNRHLFSGRYVRITAHQINLNLCEVIFRDMEGNILPIAGVERFEGDPESSLYSDPENLIDEQDTLEGLPVYFATEASGADGEENPAVAQPSWWNSTYFDEIYHARTAWEFLEASSPYETSHPPLGKILMSWGVAIFGMTPFGWRFAGAVAGVAMLAVIYLLVKQMTKETRLAAFACGLLALDCMHLTQTQIATIDSFPVLFILLAFFFMLRFLQTDWRHAEKRRVLTDLGLSGLSMGLAICSKWIGIYAGAGLAVLFFWHGFRVLRKDRMEKAEEALARAERHASGTHGEHHSGGHGEHASGAHGQHKSAGTHGEHHAASSHGENGRHHPSGSHGKSSGDKRGSGKHRPALASFVEICLWCVLFFVVIPAGLYLLCYIPYFAYRHFTNFPDYLQAVINSQQGMFNYHSTPGLGMDHPFYSPWYEWPVIGKPMFYASRQYLFNDELVYSIFCIGNPVIWWLGIPALAACAWAWIRNREERIALGKPIPGHMATLDTNLVFLLVGFLAQYLPWTLVPRGTYIYHYFASVPFLVLALTLCFQQIKRRWDRAGRIGMAVFLLCALAALIFYFPYVTGIMAPKWWLDLGKNSILHVYY